MDSSAQAETLTGSEFERRAADWDDLIAGSVMPVPFLTSPWLLGWMRHFGGEQELRVPTVSEGGRLLAGVPLVLRKVTTPAGRVTLAEIVGTGPVPTRGMGLADKVALAVRRDHPEAAALLAAEIRRACAPADVLDLKGLDADSQGVAALRASLETRASSRVLPRSVSPYLPLPGTWDEYLASRSHNFRKHLRKYRKLLEARGEVEIARWQAGDDLEPWFKEVTTVNQSSWTADRGTNLFRHPALRAFLFDVIRGMAAQGWLDLQVLRIDGTAVVYELCFDFAGRVFSYNGSYHRDLRRESPGTVLTAHVIESACGRGDVEYDLLRGTEEYKLRWTETKRSESQLLIPGSSLRGRAYTAWQTTKARLKQSAWLSELDDRWSGLRNRLRHGDAPPATRS